MPINTRPHIHEMVICANMFVRKGGKYLLLKRSSHKLFMPDYVHPIGGKVDPEARRRAAQDEVRQAQASWSRLGFVPDEARRELADRFQRAVRQVM